MSKSRRPVRRNISRRGVRKTPVHKNTVVTSLRLSRRGNVYRRSRRGPSSEDAECIATSGRHGARSTSRLGRGQCDPTIAHRSGPICARRLRPSVGRSPTRTAQPRPSKADFRACVRVLTTLSPANRQRAEEGCIRSGSAETKIKIHTDRIESW